MFGNEATVETARLRHLGFCDNLIDDSGHVPTGGRILRARQISNRQHIPSPFLDLATFFDLAI
jgi:hypothetical protein